MNKRIIIGGVILFSVAVLVWLLYVSTRALPGTKVTDLGRGHVEAGTEVKYNSNPPTSGEHYGDWVRAGIYTDVKDDRNLVHSLEHGYVILSYKCKVQSAKLEEATMSAEASSSGQPEAQEDCNDRRVKLEEIYNKKGKKKLIVVVRPNLDTNFALTAWAYLDKFDGFDSQRIEKFIDAHRDNGPERTME